MKCSITSRVCIFVRSQTFRLSLNFETLVSAKDEATQCIKCVKKCQNCSVLFRVLELVSFSLAGFKCFPCLNFAFCGLRTTVITGVQRYMSAKLSGLRQTTQRASNLDLTVEVMTGSRASSSSSGGGRGGGSLHAA